MASATDNPQDQIHKPVRDKPEILALRSRLQELEEQIKELEHRHEIASSANEFLAVLSHEIRTPLNVIIGLSDLLLNDDPKPEQIQNLKSLAFSAENMMNLVNNILDFNKIKSGRMSHKSDTFNIRETIHDLEKSYSLHADKNCNELVIDMDPDIPEVVGGDRLKLIQVLSNLLNNSLKFTRNGRVTLDLQQIDEKEDKVNLYFSVRDTGPGISEKNIETIFERFSRTDDSVTKRVGGTGLGLFMVQSLLRMMGSEINVNSEVGEGSDFHFNLTLEKPAEQARKQGKKEESLNGGTHRILLAEDMEEHRDVLRQYFEQQEHLEFTIVSDGEAALEGIKSKKFEIVFLDIKMPKMNGHDVVRHIRSLEDDYYKSVPIIALTADVFTIEENQEQFTDIITKPFKFRELIEMINQHSNR